MFGEYSSARAVQRSGVHTQKAHAKVNLILRVGSPRGDGYHPVATVLHTLALHDTVQISWKGLRSQADGAPPVVSVVTDDPTLPSGLENLAGQAVLVLQGHLQQRRWAGGSIEVYIRKRIPVAAGLAGGSADAAAVLRGLNSAFDLGISPVELCALGGTIGSDVPACVLGGSLFGQGRGERVRALNSGRYWWVLVNPGGALSAREVYEAFDAEPDEPGGPELEWPLSRMAPGFQEALASSDPRRLAPYLYNDLESPVARLSPETARLRQRLLDLGAMAALVSGSGPTVAALAAGPDDAERLAERIRPDVPWVWWGASVGPLFQ